jgi:hypothetical protein
MSQPFAVTPVVTAETDLPASNRMRRLLAFWNRYGVWLAVVVAAWLVFELLGVKDFMGGMKAGFEDTKGDKKSIPLLGLYGMLLVTVSFLIALLSVFSYIYYRLIHRPLLGQARLPFTILFVFCFLIFWSLIGKGITSLALQNGGVTFKLGAKTVKDQTEMGLTITTVVLAAFSLLFGFWMDRRRTRKQQKALLQQRTQAQLDALKAQVNPHFLFNSLNNIFGTAMQEQAPRTAESVEQLATIMRYVLDESRNQTTAVERELRFIDDYIHLHKLRLPTLDHIRITTDLFWDEQPAEVVPLLLNPLIENAFKYGISIQHPCFVSVGLRVEAGVLTLETRNSVLARNELERGTGTGLANVRQRLALAYPDRHTLTLQPGEHEFVVRLTIRL